MDISGSSGTLAIRPCAFASVRCFAKYAPSTTVAKPPSHMWSYWSGRSIRSRCLSRSSFAGNFGLSRQFSSTILTRESVLNLNRFSTAAVLRFGFHVTHSSAFQPVPSSRSVGMSVVNASSVTGSASSTQHSRMRPFDLMLAMFRSRPANANDMRPSRLLMYLSPTS